MCEAEVSEVVQGKRHLVPVTADLPIVEDASSVIHEDIQAIMARFELVSNSNDFRLDREVAD